MLLKQTAKGEVNKDINSKLQAFLYDVATTAANTNFFKKVIEFNNDPNDTASTEASLLLVTKPTLKSFEQVNANNFSSEVFLLGGVMNFSPNESKQIVPIKEIGSARKRLVPGPTQYSASLSRLLTGHSNVRYALYQWLFKLNKTLSLVRAPGPNNNSHFSGFESEIYKIPFGMINLKATAGGDVIGADFLERCFLTSVNIGQSAQSPVIAENISFMITRIIPVISGYVPKNVINDNLTTYTGVVVDNNSTTTNTDQNKQ